MQGNVTEEKVTGSVLPFLGKALLVTLGIGVTGYVIYKVAKEYDDTVDKYNELCTFVENHDFYKKESGLEPKADLVRVNILDSEEDGKVEVWQDPLSGFKIYKTVS